MNVPAIITPESVTVLFGGQPRVFAKGDTNGFYEQVVDAVRNGDMSALQDVMDAAKKVAERLKGLKIGSVELIEGHVIIDGQPASGFLVDRIIQFQQQNLPIQPLMAFLDRVSRNPSYRAVTDLYRWCEANNMPITPDGRIIGYKIVRSDFMDVYTGKLDNSPGKVVTMPRNKVDEDPTRTCSAGLHFCSASYLPHYGGYDSNRKIVLVAICPSEVVAFPTDYGLSKARCCGYEVLEEIEQLTAAEFFKDKDGVYGDLSGFRDDLDNDGYEIEDRDAEEENEAEEHLLNRLDYLGFQIRKRNDGFHVETFALDLELHVEEIDQLVPAIQKELKDAARELVSGELEYGFQLADDLGFEFEADPQGTWSVLNGDVEVTETYDTKRQAVFYSLNKLATKLPELVEATN